MTGIQPRPVSALVADSNRRRINGFASLGVAASTVGVTLRFRLDDPIIGMTITPAILKVT